MLRRCLRIFSRTEDGAVTTDWVALTTAAILLTIAAVLAIGSAITSIAEDSSAGLSDVEVTMPHTAPPAH